MVVVCDRLIDPRILDLLVDWFGQRERGRHLSVGIRPYAHGELVSPLQCRRHGGEYLAGTASVLLHCLPVPSLSPHCCPRACAPAQLCYAAQAEGGPQAPRPPEPTAAARKVVFRPHNHCSLAQKTRARAFKRKKLILAVASRPPRHDIWHVGAPGGVTPLEAHENFSALAGPLSTNLVRRSRPRSANYSALWLRLHLRLRLRSGPVPHTAAPRSLS